MLKKFKKLFAFSRLKEEKLYELVAKEIKNGIIRDGLWAKALAHCNGDREKAKSLYIQYRIQSLRDESEINKKRKKIPTNDPEYIRCPYCNFTQWIGYKKCQKCGKELS